jgi:hypothetical protein
MKFLATIFAAVVIVVLPAAVTAQITWNLTSATGTGTPLPANISSATAITVGNSNGTATFGGTTTPSTVYSGFSGTGNGNVCARLGALSTAANGSAYLEVTLTPAAGFAVRITDMSWGNYWISANSPRNFNIRTSIDNYTADIAVASTGLTAAGWGLLTPTITETTGAAGTAVIVRVYASGTGTSAAANTITWRIDDLKIAATAVPVIEAANGNVGIGINPTAKLEINGQIKINGLASVPASLPGAGKVLTSDANGLATWVTPAGGGTVTSITANGGTTGLTFTGSPITTSGTLSMGGLLAITSGGTNATTTAGAINNLLPSQTSNYGKVLQTDGNNVSWAPQTPSYWSANGNNISNITTGNVGIGTVTPDANAKLDVNGNILSNGIVAIGPNINWASITGNVDPTLNYRLAVNGNAIFERAKVKLNVNWPDYVFKKDYQLPSLKDVEAFIKKNYHLPNVPAEAEIKKYGIDLGDNQIILLKKIEELTLYIIEQNKKIEALQANSEMMNTLKAEIETLKQLIAQLKK